MLIFDIETNGLLDTLTKIHCMVIDDGTTIHEYTPDNIEYGVQKLQQALNQQIPICGHNIINFDIPAIQKLYDWFTLPPLHHPLLIVDTLVLSRLVYSNLMERDAGLVRKGTLPSKLWGSHSLKAWGYRLGTLKGTYAEETEDAWAVYNDDMLSYNKQDVKLTKLLYTKLTDQKYPEQSILLEHKAALLMSKQERNGFKFDLVKAKELEKVLRDRSDTLIKKLESKIPPIPDTDFIPKKDNIKLGYTAGVPVKRYKTFKPNSRQQIEWLITEYFKYEPGNEDLFDDTGTRLKIDETTFKYIKNDTTKCPEELRNLAVLFEEQLTISKRLGQLAEGKHAWITHCTTEGFIHGSVNPNGAVTGRATHSRPNVAQVPKVGSAYGKECRELFGVPEGWYQCGVDASGLELRCLAHFMYPYDSGVYADTVVHGDIHTMNQTAAGLPTRDKAKTFIYAFLYGAGDNKIGKIVDGSEREGKKLKRDFLKKTPAIAELKKAIESVLISESDKGRATKWKRRYLKGLDGRLLHIRSIHSALNTLLQSAGALICKYWIVRLEERLINKGYTHGWTGDFAYMAWIHDEVQIACQTKEIAEDVIKEAELAMHDTKEYFNFRVSLGTEGKIGTNWSDCH